ncbi:MAG: hypothetical protein ACO26I_03065 [Burkholderiaceae bacterium]
MPRQRDQASTSIAAPSDRSAACVKGGISGSAALAADWLMPHSTQHSRMQISAVASSRVLLSFMVVQAWARAAAKPA